jgi:ribosome biogenesis GTPase
MKRNLQKGLVMRSTGSWYQVLTSDKVILDCRIKGKFRLDGIRTTNPVVVGDNVRFEDMGDGTGVISKIEPRRNYIIRKSVNLSRRAHIIAANIDRAYLIVTLASPATSAEFIDRFLVAAEANHIPVTIIFNKVDVYSSTNIELLENWISNYTAIGYQCMTLSAFNSEDVDRFRGELTDKVNLLSGHSGVGKSTLINAVEEGLMLKTGEISELHQEGTHTTTFAEIFPLSSGGFIIDTPGIKGFGIIDIDKESIAHYFPEMHKLRSSCKFSNCVHVNEPKCAVKDAVEKGEIAASRYRSYLSIYSADEDGDYRRNPG